VALRLGDCAEVPQPQDKEFGRQRAQQHRDDPEEDVPDTAALLAAIAGLDEIRRAEEDGGIEREHRERCAASRPVSIQTSLDIQFLGRVTLESELETREPA
jgi:hypothetical protein